MTTKTYAITEEQRNEVMAYLKRKPLDADGADVVITLDLLPLITGEPVGKVLNRGKKILHTGWLNEVGLQLPDNTPLYTHPQPLPNKTLEDLLGQYWDIAHKEGDTRDPNGSAANDVLHKIRSLFKPLQPITADDVTDEMQVEISKQRELFLSKKCFASVINIWIKHKGDTK